MNITYTLPMKSQYSIKIYELCKSYQNLYLEKKKKGEPLVWSIETLKKQVDCNASNWAHVRRTVLDKAKSEINGKTDILLRLCRIRKRPPARHCHLGHHRAGG